MPPLRGMQTEDSNDLEVDYDKNVTGLYESISESDWDVAIDDVKANPEEAKTWVVRRHRDGVQDGVMWRFLPIHSACARQPPEPLINTLLSVYPDGAKCLDDQGMLPIHYACGNQASIEVIRLLLLANADGAFTADPNGMLPIHYVSQWGPSSPSVINVLLFSNRNVANAKDIDGNTPLDLAREGDYPERDDVVYALEQLGDSDSLPEPEPEPEPVAEPMRVSNEMMPEPQQMQELQSQDEPERERVMMMPKTSPAVQRLQEAAAAQRKAREDHLKQHQQESTEGREESDSKPTPGSAFNLRTRSPASTVSCHREMQSFNASTDDASMNDAGSDSTMKMVARLKAEVNKLRAEASFAETEAEEKIHSERDAMEAALEEAKEKLTKSQQETMDSLSELTAKEEFGQFVEARFRDKENDLVIATNKNEKFNSDIKNMEDMIQRYKEKTKKLEEHLSTLSESMQGMIKEQECLMKASCQHEEHMKKIALERQQKMQELIDQEVHFARMSLEKQKQSELGSEEMINEALQKQKDLMAAVIGVLKDSRQCK
mmetsp:Transcript_753/g.835  ORF Transcript_753/g.835 Transcript_753/m.835 type:complete len:546 (+) Transcript_753:75-1712(+)